MATATSYRLDEDLKRRLAERAVAQGSTETALVTRLLDEGLKVATHPGVVYRDGPTGRRAAVAGGPDVWEVAIAVRHAAGSSDEKIVEAALSMGLPERLVRISVDFASAHPDEIEARIAHNEAESQRAQEMAEQRARLLAS